MRKGKALVLGVLCSVTASLALADSQLMLMLASAAGAVLFFGIWFYKYQRDRNIVAQARLERSKDAQSSHVVPPMTSKGSCRLFVPPPLDKR